MAGTTKKFTLCCAIALGSGVVVGLSLSRPAPSPAHDSDRPAAQPAQVYRMPFVATDFGPEELAMIERLSEAASGGGGRGLVSIMAELELLEDTQRDQLLAELIPRLAAEGLGNLLVALEGSDGIADALVAERLVKLDPDRFFLIAKARGNAWNFLPLIGYVFLASVDPEAAQDRLEREEDEDTDEIAGWIAMGKTIRSTADGVAWLRESQTDDEGAEYADLITAISLTDPRQTLGEVLKIDSPEARGEALEALFGAWGHQEPAVAFAAAKELDGGDKSLVAVLAAWGRLDPETAIAQALDPGQEAAVLGSWIQSDPFAAADWAEQHLEGKVLADFLVVSAGLMPASATGALLEKLAPPERQQLFLDDPALLQRLATADLPMAIAEAQRLPPDAKGAADTGKNFASLVAHDDLTEAIQIARTLPQGPLRDGFVQAVASEGGRTDPAATLEWLDGQAVDERHSAETQLFTSWSDVDPQAALQAAEDRGAGGDTIGRIIEQWTKHADAALVFESVRGDFLGSPQIQAAMTDAWLNQNPSAGADLLMANNAAGEFDHAIIGLLKSWAQSDAQEASQYVREQIPTGPLRAAIEAIAP